MQNELSEQTRKILLIVMIAGCFFSTLNQTLLNVALSDLMNTLFGIAYNNSMARNRLYACERNFGSNYGIFNKAFLNTPTVY